MPHLWDNNKRAYYICIIRVTEKKEKESGTENLL